MTDPHWTDLQPNFRDLLHKVRSHFSPADECAECDQDADLLAQEAFKEGLRLRSALEDKP